ncbi:acyl-CoA thioesterase [Tumebacillus permanentifrigoris]|uniref:Acyl-CoA thioester hydrolase n=1 Tax=Tumebacillus permanentifrigoris TaxID=378543 RepID=A0A316DB55_9BACL|nr:acyl-CoA thioesterase [Tumebacillus permanentifrigoris]PWK13930.1 acyl-CoA thioester hydrolase [Tumebacillus permanentifrigoris]
MYTYELVVRFNDCDALGHVNNATYYTFFEEARGELFRIFNPDLNIRNWNLIVASNACDFLREAVYAQKLTVLTWIGKIGGSSFVVEQALQDEQGNWVARGKATLLGFDFEHHQALPLSAEQRQQLEQHREGPVGVPALRS